MIFICSLMALLGGFFGALIATVNEKEHIDKKTFKIILNYVSNICLGVSFGILFSLTIEFIYYK